MTIIAAAVVHACCCRGLYSFFNPPMMPPIRRTAMMLRVAALRRRFAVQRLSSAWVPPRPLVRNSSGDWASHGCSRSRWADGRLAGSTVSIWLIKSLASALTSWEVFFVNVRRVESRVRSFSFVRYIRIVWYSTLLAPSSIAREIRTRRA